LKPEEVLENHPLTERLRALGASDAVLENIRFKFFKPNFAFESWSLTASQPAAMALLRQNLGLCKAYCTLRWLLLDDPPPSPNRTQAWDYVARIEAEPIYRLGMKTSQNQKERAAKPRGKVGDNDETVSDIIQDLLNKPEYRAQSAKELWPHFLSSLKDHGLDPELGRAGAVWYNSSSRSGRRQMALPTFANKVSQLRKKSR